MPREFSRSQRMAEQIRRDLAEIVRDELKDPRMGFLSFSAVKLSRDLGNAVIYCSVMEQDKQAETLETLNRATGFLRSKLASRMRSRTVPILKFINDESRIESNRSYFSGIASSQLCRDYTFAGLSPIICNDSLVIFDTF